MIDPGRLNRRVRIERMAAPSNDPLSAGQRAWEEVVTVWAEVIDQPPSRADRIVERVSLTSRPCRVLMHFRRGISSDMRLVLEGRTLHIVGGPSELGYREGLEIMAAEEGPAA